MSPKAKSRTTATIEFLATFLLLFLVTNFALKFLFPNQFGSAPAEQTVVLQPQSSSFRSGNNPVLLIRNLTKKDLPLKNPCPQPPVDIASVKTDSSGVEQVTDLMANDMAISCNVPQSVAAGQTYTLDLGPWKYSLLAENGTYEAALELPAGFLKADAPSQRITTRFSIYEAGFLAKVFRTFVTEPLFNGLLLIAVFVPGHNLGVAIILLTILVKLVLLIPNQHALEGQKKLQQLQPRVDEIKRKYPNDPKRVQEETMHLWKELKINPLQSCLPMLLQLPILIGLFYVVRSGATIETARHLLYPYFLNRPPLALGQAFLGLDLLKPNKFILPPLLVILQFVQMKMMMAKQKRASDKPDLKAPAKPAFDQQTLMLYGLPFMIGFFALGFPAAVSIYWGVSTLFGIAQQWYVMREKL